MDWKKELDNKFNNMTKEAANEQAGIGSLSSHRGDSSRSSSCSVNDKVSSVSRRSNSSGSRGVFCGSVSTEIIKVTEKEEKRMITVDAALKDLNEIEVSDVADGVKIVRAFKVIVKFLSTIRSNQLLTSEDKARIQKEKRNRKPEVQIIPEV